MNPRRLTLSILAMTLGALAFAIAPAFALKVHVFSSSFGSKGTGNGQFKEPAGVAVSEVGGSSGDVYVVDKGNNRVEVFNSEGTYLSQFNGSAAPTGAFSSPQWIAVDNSTNPLDPSAGDVYVTDTGHKVVDKFTATGAYLGQIVGAGAAKFEEGLFGAGVDTSGVLWIYYEHEARGYIASYSDALANAFVSSHKSEGGSGGFAGPGLGFAVDSEDNLYVGEFFEEITKVNSSGEVLIEPVNRSKRSTAVAVDPSTNDSYIDSVTTVGVFSPAGTEFERFGAEGSGHLTAGSGLAVSSSSAPNKPVYVADSSADAVRVFTEVVVPDVTTEAASNVTPVSASLNGVVNPAETSVTGCEFEYGTSESYGSTAPCSQTLPLTGKGPVLVTTKVKNLLPNTQYHVRLAASNASGTNRGLDVVFTTPGPPVIESDSFSNVGSGSAIVHARIDPEGLPSAYRVEYGTTTAYGSSTPSASAGAGHEPVGVVVALSGLQPNTVYYARVVASNEFGGVVGAGFSFSTFSAALLGLPDERGYELVTPPNNEDAEPYETEQGRYSEKVNDAPDDSDLTAEAAVGGDAVVYAGDPTGEGNGVGGHGVGGQYLATRSAGGGWTQSSLQPHGYVGEVWQGFSSDLSRGVLQSCDSLSYGLPPLSAAAPAGYDMLYARSLAGGDWEPFLTGAPPSRLPREFGAFHARGIYGHCYSEKSALFFAGESADFSDLLFEANDALNQAALTAPPTSEENDLYDSVGGVPVLVNVLPSGEVQPNATFGGRGKEAHPALSNDISVDGSRVFWTDLHEGPDYEHIFVREGGTRTVPVSEGAAYYWTATSDGRYVFYSEGEKLYRFDVEGGARTLITSSFVALLGASEDTGDYIYYLDTSHDLDLWHEGVNTVIHAIGAVGEGDLSGYLGESSVEATPDGKAFVFTSGENLTGYPHEGFSEVYRYDTSSGVLLCVSCSPTGEPPEQNPDTVEGFGGNLPVSLSPTYRHRWVSSNGGRVFFESSQPLVPQDTNRARDVYEWEAEGEGTCTRASAAYSGRDGGCIYILSGGTTPSASVLLDADATGDNVFFITRAQLTPQDGNEDYDLYDARVGAPQPVSTPVCSGTGCQGVPSAPPVFATPATVTFAGAGDFPSPVTVVKEVTKKKTVKCKKNFVRKKNKCVRRPKAKKRAKARKDSNKRRAK